MSSPVQSYKDRPSHSHGLLGGNPKLLRSTPLHGCSLSHGKSSALTIRALQSRRRPPASNPPAREGASPAPAAGWETRPEVPASASRRVLGSVNMNPVVVVHGGRASSISKDRKERVRQGVVRAATVGYSILKEGKSAVDAVEGAVTVLEDDPEFNAGHGSVLNVNGEVEMDASIMNGKDLSAGAVSAVRCVANPIKLARLVMEQTSHCFLTGQGAAKFAASMGVPTVPGQQLVTERNMKRLEEEKHEKRAQKPGCQKDMLVHITCSILEAKAT